MITAQQLNADYQATAPDAHVVATAWVQSAAAFKGNIPAAQDLAEMITGIGQDLTMQGAPQLEIDLLDVDFILMDAGFFDPSDRGRLLDKVEINYPAGSRYFWRLFQYSPSANFQVQTYWIPRVVDDLMNLKGPFSANRAQRTRAEFMKMCVDKVGYAHFYSKQLTVKQPIANLNLPTGVTTADPSTAGAKGVGLNASNAGIDGLGGLTVQFHQMGKRQKANATTLLRVADQLNAGKIATEALIYAAIWESNMESVVGPNSQGFWGILSGKDTVWQQNDTVGMARAFLLGNSAKGFQGGGAIALSRSITNPIEIAVKVEVPSIWPDNAYAKEASYTTDADALTEVRAIIEAGGGASGAAGVQNAPTETVQQYNFQIGTSSAPHEDYWTGMNRLAQEVNWELVVDGDDVHYDSDVTLARATIKDTINRSDLGSVDWAYDWCKTELPTNFQMTLEIDPFQYAPADVLKLVGFGPASIGSTIGLPGRWLVGEIQRTPGDIVSTLTLLQPTKQLREPAPSISTDTSGAKKGSFAPGSVLAAIQAAQRLSNKKLPYDTGHRTLTIKPPKPPEGYDCSAGVSWVLLTAGFPLPKNATWGDWAPLSGDFESWGQPGPGREMTVWCNGDHIFIEFNVPNIGHVGFDSGHDSSERLWFQTPFADTAYVSGGAFVARHWKGT